MWGCIPACRQGARALGRAESASTANALSGHRPWLQAWAWMTSSAAPLDPGGLHLPRSARDILVKGQPHSQLMPAQVPQSLTALAAQAKAPG